MRLAPVGSRVQVRVSATSANLGPGYDSAGLALGIFDELSIRLEPVGTGLRIDIEGEGAGQLPTDSSHLVYQALTIGLAECGLRCDDLTLECSNRIPQGRGLGSSSAAIVGGLRLARGLVVGGDSRLDDAALIDLGTKLEGHPDNIAPAVLSGFTIAWMAGAVGRAVRAQPHPSLRAVAFVPPTQVSTSSARRLLPESVALADAAFNLARSALLYRAITTEPELLFEATADRLHQESRRAAYPDSLRLVEALRSAGFAAFISGAGPTVLVLAAAAAVGEVKAFAAEIRATFGDAGELEPRVLDLV